MLFEPSIKYAAIVGIFMALAALCRMVFLAFVPFIFLWFIIAFYRERRKMLFLLCTILISFSLIYSVWLIREYKAILTEIVYSLSNPAWRAKEILQLRKDWIAYPNYKARAIHKVTTFVNWTKENPRQYFGRCKEHLKIFLFSLYAKGVSFRHKIVSSFIFYIIYPLG